MYRYCTEVNHNSLIDCRAVAGLILMIRTTGGGTRRVCPQGWSSGKITFARNRKKDGWGRGMPEFVFQKIMTLLKTFDINLAINGAFWRYMKRCFRSWYRWNKKMKSRWLNPAFWRYLKRLLFWKLIRAFQPVSKTIVWEFQSDENILKTRTLNGSYIKR